MEAFGNKDTTINRLRKGETNKTDIEAAVLQYNNIHLAVCPAGEVLNTLAKLRSSPSRLNKLYVELLKDNPEWGTVERRHDMNHFMADELQPIENATKAGIRLAFTHTYPAKSQ